MKISYNEFILRKKCLKPNTKIQIISASMEPYIFTGEYIRCSPKGINSVQPGEAIVFWRDDKLICHFLLRKVYIDNKTYLETKGLNSRKIDPLSPEENYFAIVTSPKISFIKRKFFIFLSRFSKKT